MAVQGKKINELTAIGTVSDETVLPAVYVSGTTVNSTANKISIEQISTKVQDDMSTTLAGKQDTLVSGTNIKTINNESLLGSGNLDVDALPSQTGQSGKFLATNGTTASWEKVNVPSNVWTQDNLVAGENITITKQLNPYVINEDTLAIFHLDGNFNNGIDNSNFSIVDEAVAAGYESSFLTGSDKKFGTAASDRVYVNGTWYNRNLSINAYKQFPNGFTIDFWAKRAVSDVLMSNGIIPGGYGLYVNGFGYVGFGAGAYSEPLYTSSWNTRVDTTNWYHIAISISQTKRRFFLDGVLVASADFSGSLELAANATSQFGQVIIDELRITNKALWQDTDDFSADLPDAPYDVGEDVYQINATGGGNEVLVTEGIVPSTVSSEVTTQTPTAPMNGWYNIVATSSGTSSYITSELTTTNYNYQVVAGYPSGSKMSLIIPAEKGTTFNFGYGSVYDVSIKFIPAETSERSMVPSNVSLNIPVQASGSVYTAPETGYINFGGNSTGTSSYITSEATTDNPFEQSITNHPNGYAISLNIPVVKGRNYKISYADINDVYCRLVIGQEVKVYGDDANADISLSNITDAGEIKVAHLAMPSGVYDELTIPSVDGSDITVPADGYLCLRGVAQGENPVLGLSNNTTGLIITSNASFRDALDFGITLPVKKGDSIRVSFYHVNFYDATAPGFLRFVYANGSESEKGA